MIVSFDAYNQPKIIADALIGYDSINKEIIVTVYENSFKRYDFFISSDEAIALAEIILKDQSK